jgi:GGDEF domain-containing protein
MQPRMVGSRAYGLALAATSVAVGVMAVVADAPGAGIVACLGGLTAGWVAARDGNARAVSAEAEGRAAAEARVAELEAALADDERQVAEAEESALALAAPPDPDPDLADAEAEALLDPVTGLYGEPFFGVTLSSRVAAARRHLRPVAIVLVEVAAGVREGRASSADPGIVSKHVKATLREADTACHLEGDRFALVLEDTPENGAVWTVERVRRALAAERKDLTLWAGVACYPAHAFDAGELLARAAAALEAAKEWRQDRIEVATTSDV